jgi:hypothetical protein
MIHAISGWLTRHARRNREQLARDHAFAAANGWHARRVNRLGTWQYRDPRFDHLRAIRADASPAAGIRAIPLAPKPSAQKGCQG